MSLFEFSDLTYYDEYLKALEDKVHAYFFMRGVEGYFSDRHTSPVYKHTYFARRWWQTGHDCASESTIVDSSDFDQINDGRFCVSFLSGDQTLTKEFSHNLGVMFRREFEKINENSLIKHKYAKGLQLTKKENTMSNSNTLYQVKGKDIYGTQVGTDSQGRVILECKAPNAGIRPYDPSEIEEVTPYTVQVVNGEYNWHFLAKEDEFVVGDILVIKTSNGLMLIEVVTVNSKCKNASGNLSDINKGFAIKKPRPRKTKAKIKAKK